MPSSRINGVLMAVLRPALQLPAGHVGTELRADYTEFLPYVHARETPGGTTARPVLRARLAVPIQVDVYAAPEDVLATCDAVLAALDEAWAAQTVTDDGYLSRVANVVGPWRFPEPDRADGVARWVITAAVTVRHAAVL